MKKALISIVLLGLISVVSFNSILPEDQPIVAQYNHGADF